MFNYALPEILPITSTGELSTPENDYLLRQLGSLLTQKNNLHGRRVGKAKDAISPGDYVTKRQLNGNLVGTLAQRPAATGVTQGTTYFATDRNVTYQARNGHWYYKDGIQDVTLSPDTKPSPSILYDTGYMIYATDFDWYYRWNLITWERLGGTSGFIQGFEVAPTQLGWGLCDGTTYSRSLDNGNVTTIVSPNLTSTAKFVKFASAYNASVAAVAPTISGGVLTGTVTLSGTAIIGGSLVVPAHAHNTSLLSDNTIVTGGEDQPHWHDADGGASTLFIDYTVSNNFNATSSNTAVTGFNGNGIGGHTDYNDVGHNHPVDVDFSGLSTDLSTGTEDIDTSSLTVDTSGLTVDSSGLSVGSITAGTNGTPISVNLIPYIRL